MFWAKKKFPSVTQRCRRCRTGNLYRRYLSRLKCYSVQILATLSHLCWIDAPHTQNFEISWENSGVKKFWIFLRFFFKTKRWAEIFRKDAYWEALIRTFFKISKFQNFLKKILKISWKTVKNLPKSVWERARELKFDMDVLY